MQCNTCPLCDEVSSCRCMGPHEQTSFVCSCCEDREPAELVSIKRIASLFANQPSAIRVAATYKSKKKIKNKDGEESIIYEYSEKQLADRGREKARRIEKLRKKMPDLRKKVLSDLKSKDMSVKLTALAVALIDETYERVGNSDSAEDRGHYGVTTWEASHVKVKGNKATITYTGKSGVDHVKVVEDKNVVSCLKEVLKGKKPKDLLLCDSDEEGCSISADSVNEYLKPFDVTAKDIRGLHANREVRDRLKEIRKKGPKELPTSRKEKDKILEAEFLEALDGAAEAVGHEASTLRSQYLVPGMESSFMHDGTVLDELDGG